MTYWHGCEEIEKGVLSYDLGTEEELLSECIRDSMSRAVRNMEQWIEQEVILPDGPYANLKFRLTISR